ncbi:MAG: sulfotransferase [Parvularculaceae bacterium]
MIAPAPGDAKDWLARGRALAKEGRGGEADAAFERYFSLAPGRKRVAEGVEAQRRGDIESAARHYAAALEEDPDNVDAMRLLGVVLALLGRGEEALRRARQAVLLAPDYLSAWSNLGAALTELDRIDEAVDAFRRALALDPKNVQCQYNLANALSAHQDFQGAQSAFRAALAIDPAQAPSLRGLGPALNTTGDRGGALDAYRASLAAAPSFGEVWWSLANLKTYRLDAQDCTAMEALLGGEELSLNARISVLYALGKALEDAGEFDASFERYAEGAALQRQRVRYDPVETETVNDRIVKCFTPQLFDQLKNVGYEDPSPIFIVGLPRSGSTLIEQILASHKSVDGAAELPALQRVGQQIGRFRADGVRFPEAVKDFERHDFDALGRAYLMRTQRFRGDKPRFTDKMPNNFALIGLIKLILPNAKVIDARRHPLDSCLGSFKQLFARGQTFTYDLFELGHYYLQYDRMMRWWDAVSPGFVLRVDYERMVMNQECETRRLLDFCDLPFEPACLEFHRTQRPVNTASSEQVRRPIYRGSLHSYRRFEKHLRRLDEMLAPILAGLPADVRAPVLPVNAA